MNDRLHTSVLSFQATAGKGKVSALLLHPPGARALLVFAHGAGAGIRHAFMEALAGQLAAVGIATFRYQFPYMEAGNRRPDPQPTLTATVCSAIAAAGEAAPGLPLFAGGKSIGGRMTSLAAAEAPLAGVRGLVFFGFPLHPAGRPATARADHLEAIGLPLLFLQGERDRLAELALLEPVCARLGRRATLHVVPMADHSFHVPKSTGRTDAEVQAELARVVASWAGCV